MEWGYHIDHIRKKIASGIYAINSANRYLLVKNLKSLYFSFVHSYLSYGAMIWSSAYQCRLHQLEILQKKAIRDVCKATCIYNAPSTPLFKHLHIPKLADIFNIQLSTFMFSYTKGMLTESLSTIFSTNSSIPSHNTRHSRGPHVVTRRTYFIARTFVHCAPKIWLDLPNNIRTIMSIGHFSSKVKKHFISLY